MSFEDITRRAGFPGCFNNFSIGFYGTNYDRGARSGLLQFSSNFNPVENRHFEVEDNYVRLTTPNALKSRLTILRRSYHFTLNLQ
jgi:hypothetical protein